MDDDGTAPPSEAPDQREVVETDPANCSTTVDHERCPAPAIAARPGRCYACRTWTALVTPDETSRHRPTPSAPMLTRPPRWSNTAGSRSRADVYGLVGSLVGPGGVAHEKRKFAACLTSSGRVGGGRLRPLSGAARLPQCCPNTRATGCNGLRSTTSQNADYRCQPLHPVAERRRRFRS